MQTIKKIGKLVYTKIKTFYSSRLYKKHFLKGRQKVEEICNTDNL